MKLSGIKSVVLLNVLVGMSFTFTGKAGAQEVSADWGDFQKLWKKIVASAPIEKANEAEQEAAQIARDRSSRHFYPMAYLNAKSYSTNDAGGSLFSKLSQRQVAPADFSPSLLNHPDRSTLTEVKLGVLLSLYEGGLRSTQSNQSEKALQSSIEKRKADLQLLYSETLRIYSNGLLYSKIAEELKLLNETIVNTLSKYRVGAVQNPVGYSGLLGLKSVQNRVKGMIIANDTQQRTIDETLSKLAEENSYRLSSASRTTDSIAFMQIALKESNLKKNQEIRSNRVMQFEKLAEAAQLNVDAERSRFLPKAGLFAENSVIRGSRDTAAAFTAGAFFQWDIFVPQNYGSMQQANAQAVSATQQARALNQREEIERLQQANAIQASLENVKVLEDSTQLLNEQTQTAKTLFLNGSMNALQLAEVFNRRADLIQAEEKASELFLLSSAEFIKLSNNN